MRELAPNLWEHRSSCRYKTFWLFRRMTVVRLGDGGLWLHSPNALDEALRAELAELGEVRFVVAPNTHHHGHLADYRSAYPAALHVGAAGLPAKRPDLRFDAVLGEGAPLWGEELLTQPIAGMPQLNESVFFHPASRTLLTTDLLFCFGPADPWRTRLLGRLDGTYGQPAVSRDLRWRLIADREACRRSLDALAEWPAERLLMAHAQEPARCAPELLAAAWAPLGAS